MEDDGFELVTHHRKKTKGRKNNSSDKKIRPGCNDPSRPEPISDFKEFTNKFKGVCHEVRESGYFKNLKEQFQEHFGDDSFDQLVCLGVGNFSESLQARFQLALFHCMVEDLLHHDLQKVVIFEPIFTNSEVVFAKNCLGYENTSNTSSDNLEGKHQVTSECKTFVFMPHCSKQLTSNLLGVNWEPDKLEKLVILCNSFDKLCVSQPERLLREQGASLILKAAPVCKEIPLKNCFRLTDVFNDLNLHHFPELSGLDQAFWQKEDRIVDPSDLEFVPRNLNNGSKDCPQTDPQ